MKTKLALAIIVMLLSVGVYGLNIAAHVPAGYVAKVACSETFVAGRDFDDVIASDFNNIHFTFSNVKAKVNIEKKSVTGRLFGLGKSQAIYREHLGCTLDGAQPLSPISVPAPKLAKNYAIDIDPKVQGAVIPLFDDEGLSRPIITRGVVVVRDNKIIAENYADGFTPEMRQQSWSVAKGFTQALVGIATERGWMSLEDKSLFPEWSKDGRADIMLGHLLHMTSGLEFTENYQDPFSHVDQMLFNQRDMAAYAAQQKPLHAPGAHKAYSSGTSNIVSRLLRDRMETFGADYHAFPRKALFDKIGMSSAVFELDASGTYIGSSYIYATPRDFARFGQLYLQKGVWNGEQVLPEGWVDYTGQPVPASDGQYGSHWSLNTGQKTLPGLPEDVIHLGGNDGQMIIVIPSKNTVIARFGITRWPATLETDVYPLIREIYEAL